MRDLGEKLVTKREAFRQLHPRRGRQLLAKEVSPGASNDDELVNGRILSQVHLGDVVQMKANPQSLLDLSEQNQRF